MAASASFPLSIILQTIDKTTAGFNKATSNVDKISKKMVGAGKAMTAGLTLPIVSIGVAATRSFSEFEAGMASVSTLVDTSAESMKDMGKQVQAIGARTPVALDKLTSALFDIRSAGVPAANAMNVLERSAQLGVAGLGSTAQAARLAAGAINAWGLEGKDADKIFNTIFQTTKNGITTIAGLEQGFGAVAGKMASAGIEADDYFASIAALTTTTLKAAGAHTQMRAAVDGLEKSGKKTRKVFKKLGVKDFKELVKTSGGVTEAFRLVAKAAGNQSGALKDLIGSSEGAAAVTALIGKQGDKQLSTLKDMRKETVGLTDDQIAFNKQNETSAAQWQRTKNSMTNAAISIGTILAPALSKVATKIQSVAKWINGMDDSTKELIVKIAGVTAVVGPMVIVLGKVAPGVGLIITALKTLAVVATAHPMFALAAAIAAVAAFTASDFAKPDFMSDADKRFVEGLEKDPGSRFKRRERRAELEAAKDAELEAQLGGELGAPRAARAPGPGVKASDFGIFAVARKQAEAQAAGPAGTSKSHVTLEIVGKTDGVRVRSIKSEDMIDVKTGNQGG